MSDMLPSDAGPRDAQADLPAVLPEVRFLKTLVTALAVTMILGLVTIVGLLVTRLGRAAPLPELPAAITLPAGVRADAVTFARNYTVVVTDEGTVLLYRKDGTLAQTVTPD